MDDECMAKKVMISDVEGNRLKDRPRLGWMEKVKWALRERNRSVE